MNTDCFKRRVTGCQFKKHEAAESSCIHKMFVYKPCRGLGVWQMPPTAANTHKQREKSWDENKVWGRCHQWTRHGGGRTVGLIKGCCHCGVMVTHSNTITEGSVWEESAPPTHLLPIEGLGARDRLLYKTLRNHFSFRGISKSKWQQKVRWKKKDVVKLFRFSRSQRNPLPSSDTPGWREGQVKGCKPL